MSYSNSVLGKTAIQTGCLSYVHAGQEDDDRKKWGPRNIHAHSSRKLSSGIYICDPMWQLLRLCESQTLSPCCLERVRNPLNLTLCHHAMLIQAPNKLWMLAHTIYFKCGPTSTSNSCRIPVSILWELCPYSIMSQHFQSCSLLTDILLGRKKQTEMFKMSSSWKINNLIGNSKYSLHECKLHFWKVV